MRTGINGNGFITYYQQMAVNNRCYISNARMNHITHLILHSTGADNANLKRYVIPDDGYLGVNKYANGWNRVEADTLVHGVIGKNVNGDIEAYQIAPWNLRAWGCGAGSKGSGNDFCVQVEMCEDRTLGKEYAEACFNEAVKLYAFLCSEFNVSPENIWSHKEAYRAGYASNHGDPESWWAAVGADLSMDKFRAAVAEELKAAESVPFTDIDENAFYADAVKWAYKNGITNGVSNDKFAPNMQVSRAQLVTMLYRFAQSIGEA